MEDNKSITGCSLSGLGHLSEQCGDCTAAWHKAIRIIEKPTVFKKYYRTSCWTPFSGLELCVSYMYDWQVITLKRLKARRYAYTFGCLFGFSHNNCVYAMHGRFSQATPRLLNVRITGCDEFARNYMYM